MALEPFNDLLIVKQDEAATQTAGGLYLPDRAIEKSVRGTVLRVGPGAISDRHPGGRIPSNLKANDRILFQQHAGTEVEDNGEKVLILHEKNVLATLEKE